ncbi:hypothetical protein PDESU_00602 [Pontiella desulfatans]|uniref:Phosphatidylinositol mannoside acyltransferase n=1 Tax=Pontiella desulfatans TaxID=2750659 RepID=A0A6C2TWT1_PONDE|nr:hypothetical protein [Pontiella desulfatans]VGO12053.1 hypothetical protein PDESU_00602 [Pontiella desulfatans]
MPEANPPRQRGNRLGIWFFKTLMRISGLRGAYALLYPVCLHYAIFDRSAVRSALPYLSRRFPEMSAFRKWGMAYRLFISQGKNLIDRHALVAGAVEFDTAIEGYEQVKALSDGRQGFILLTSHVGNWQTVMDSLRKLNRTVHLLMKPEMNVAVRDAVQVDAEESRIRIISPDQQMGGVLQVMDALEQGDIVSIMGDRAYGADSVQVDFMGAKVHFPYSAFHIAAAAKCPVVVLLSSKEGVNAYSVNMAEVLWPNLQRGLDRRAQLAEWVQKYADILENYLLAHPLQYFIFHDIWMDAD